MMMTMNNVKLTIIFLLLSMYSVAQIPVGGSGPLSVSMPTIVPAGPEATSLIKAGNLAVNMQSGAASVSIPFANVNFGSIQLPISLNYASNGTKVDEIPSRVGLNWALNVGGVITRTTFDDPDDQSTQQTEPANILDQTQSVLNYLKAVTNTGQGIDAQPDEYRYNINGLSGKFIIRNNQVIQIPKTKIKITTFSTVYGIDQFIITATDGTKYYFGGDEATEVTRTYNLSGLLPTKPRIKTAWFLKRIVSLNNDEAFFHYSNIPIMTEPGISMTATKPDLINYATCNGVMPDNSVTSSATLIRVDYDSPLLLSITSTNGKAVTFQYQNRPDNSNDKRLQYMTYSDVNVVTKFALEYDDFTGNQGVGNNSFNGTYLNRRFFLKKISSISLTEPPLEYSFEYNDAGNLPHRLSYAQDHYGFYNGQNNYSLFPSGVMPYYISWVGAFLPGNRNPSATHTQKGILKKVTYPTGGTESFEYEGTNGFCGVRVSKITSYDPVMAQTTNKYYTYSGQTSGATPEYLTKSRRYIFCGGFLVQPQDNYVLHTNSLTPTHLYDGSQRSYTNVKVSDDINNVNGYVEHVYENWYFNGTNVLWGEKILSAPLSNLSTANGSEIETNYYNSNNELVKKVANNFITDARLSQQNSIKLYYKKWDYPYTSNPPQLQEFEAFDINEYLFHSEWVHLANTTTTEYIAGVPTQSTVVNYTYDNLENLQLTTISTNNSKNETIRVEKKYPNDLLNESPTDGQPYQYMVSTNNIDAVIEERSFNNNVQTLYRRNEMNKDVSENNVRLAYVQLKKDNQPAETRLRYYKYDAKFNPLELSKENDIHISYIWDYYGALPTAEATNAAWNDIAYTSFELEGGTGNWSLIGPGGCVVDGLPLTLEGFTSSSSYCLASGNIVNLMYTPQRALTYLITYWRKNLTGNSTVNGVTGTVLTTKGNWSLIQHKLVNPATITISGDALIDELRMYPITAQMKTMTYKNGVGIATINDDRNYILTYEYDGLNRLKRIRDLDKNIIKQLDYKYGTTATTNPCSNTAPTWVATGAVRCIVDVNTGNFTGIQEREERDQNNCSLTYWQTRWVSNGANASCTPITCTGDDKRIINGVCTLGTKHVVSSVMNGNGTWTCTFYYTWSDGYQGPNITTYGNSSCIDIIDPF
jgi:YD repeat-containing protein